MKPSGEVQELPPELRESEALLRAAYPAGIPETDYLPVLALLYEGMSFRTLATVVSHFTGRPWEGVYNDVLGATSYEGPDEKAKAPVRRILQQHGYDAWLLSED
jgi:hypothetical protein